MKKAKILDKGFVRLVDFMGSDEAIVQAARVSLGKGLKSPSEDNKLIEYLMKNGHTSPFEQVVLKFHVKMPLFVARQWVRHRTASINEMSARYSVIKDEFYIPTNDFVCKQDTVNKQGSSERVNKDVYELFIWGLKDQNREVYAEYENMIRYGVSRETARIMLPLNIYTQMYWTMDLHNLFHFIKLRISAHAQAEIREYAKVLLNIAYDICPKACEAFEDYVLHEDKNKKQGDKNE